MFINGVLNASNTWEDPYLYLTSSGNTHLGSEGNSGICGMVDELRISNRARSEEWIKAQYMSMSDGYITFNEVENSGVAKEAGQPEKNVKFIQPSSANLVYVQPNPFTQRTSIQYKVQSNNNYQDAGMLIRTHLAVYNADGHLIKVMVNDGLAPGKYNIDWDGRDYSGQEVKAGIYFYEFTVDDKKEYGTVIYSTK